MPDTPISPPPSIERPRPLKWYHPWISFGAYWFIRLIASTIRWRISESSKALALPHEQQFIFGVWHNRLALTLVVYQRFFQKGNTDRRLAVMASASQDGGVLVEVLRKFGVEPVRGSTSRRGRQALLEICRWGKKGLDVAITPDGPRGPRYKVQEGIMSLAQITGIPLLPISYEIHWKISLRSWDGFQIPLPFTRCNLHYAEPMSVPRKMNDAEKKQTLLEFQRRMESITFD
ncbi:MAG TPA: DUF374 domain-containing protein [Verrucomicrobiales bacterium]|jgi:hypothetical protein|nr:DUF374 domain-containing protein [Verrucomicrobiales bacterium]